MTTRYESKYVGVVEISDPEDVKTELDKISDEHSNGGIFCSCPEIGMEGTNLIYCRYALSIPWYKVKDGDRMWIEPTIGDTERWIYSGFVDCGREGVAPGSTDQMILLNDSGKYTMTLGNMTIVLDSDAKTVTIDANGDAKAKVILDADTEQIDVICTGAINIDTASGQKITIGGSLEVTVP
jgi:hypothetical protein